jgi:hypothetical protein
LTIIIVSQLTSYYLLYTSKWVEAATKAVTEVATTEVEMEVAMGVAMELAPKLAPSATSLDTQRKNVSTTQTQLTTRGKATKTKTSGATIITPTIRAGTITAVITMVAIATAASNRRGLANTATNRVTGTQTALTWGTETKIRSRFSTRTRTRMERKD